TEAAAIGIWDHDRVNRVTHWDARCKQLFGLSPDVEASYEVFLKGLHPDDRDHVHEGVQAAITPGGSGVYNVEYRA
ncbi:MAG: PAS domain-containing protein, partial [Gammaproteobacteria bacterium]|nr:PAS domain-containing protein [Gammaproteobacteria bacterium]